MLFFVLGYTLPLVATLAFWGKKQLEVNREGFLLGEEKIKFEEVRSVYIKKDVKGWGVYIYVNSEIKPKMDFNVQSIHDMLALQELIAYAGKEEVKEEKSLS